MSVWSTYLKRINAQGDNSRSASLKREQNFIRNRLPDNLSFTEIKIDDVFQQLAVINTDNFAVKHLHSLPGERIKHGGIVEWEGNHWLVTELDAKDEVYTSAKMQQCNHLLKWMTDDKVLHEEWCIVEDGTNYLTGEFEDRDLFVTRGDTRIAVTMRRTPFTAQFTRSNRFLIDDEESEIKLAYQLTKPFKLTNVYNGNGVYKFIMQEVASVEDDNHELGIADYYKYFPRKEDIDEVVVISPEEKEGNTSEKDNNGKKVWI